MRNDFTDTLGMLVNKAFRESGKSLKDFILSYQDPHLEIVKNSYKENTQHAMGVYDGNLIVEIYYNAPTNSWHCKA